MVRCLNYRNHARNECLSWPRPCRRWPSEQQTRHRQLLVLFGVCTGRLFEEQSQEKNQMAHNHHGGYVQYTHQIVKPAKNTCKKPDAVVFSGASTYLPGTTPVALSRNGSFRGRWRGQRAQMLLTLQEHATTHKDQRICIQLLYAGGL